MDERSDEVNRRSAPPDESPTLPAVPVPPDVARGTPPPATPGSSETVATFRPDEQPAAPLREDVVGPASPVPPVPPGPAAALDATGATAPTTGAAARPSTDEEESPEELRQDIAATRAQMSQTIDQLEDRLKPERLSAQARQQAQAALLDRARPAIQAANTAIERVTPIAQQARERVTPIAQQARERVTPIAQQARDQAQMRLEQARRQAQELQRREDVQEWESTLRARAPQILGALAALVGVLWVIGRILGRSRRPDEEEDMDVDDELDEPSEIVVPAEVIIERPSRRLR